MRPHEDRLPHASPLEGCACVVCDGARLAHLRELSSAQRRALAALDPAIPRHVDDLRRAGLRWRTATSLMFGTRRRPALISQIELRRPLRDAPYYSFLLLTSHGADAVAARRRAKLPL